MVSTFVLWGITIAITSLSLLSALAGWYYCLTVYREDLSERAYDALKYVLPPFLLLSASPLFDVVLWQAGVISGAQWPLIGARGMIVGLGGVAVVVGFVVYDLRSGTDAPTPGLSAESR